MQLEKNVDAFLRGSSLQYPLEKAPTISFLYQINLFFSLPKKQGKAHRMDAQLLEV
jgi:hypothetical protein